MKRIMVAAWTGLCALTFTWIFTTVSLAGDKKTKTETTSESKSDAFGNPVESKSETTIESDGKKTKRKTESKTDSDGKTETKTTTEKKKD